MPTIKNDAELKAAFWDDGFEMDPNIVRFQGRRGIVARHRTEMNSQTRKPKKAYYVEGTGYEMGYLLGVMAETEARAMTRQYVHSVIPFFLSPGANSLMRKILFELMLGIVEDYCQLTYAAHQNDIPKQLWDEMHGLADGCKAGNPGSPVTFEDVLSLNAGFDCALAAFYTGIGLGDALDHLLDSIGVREKLMPGITAAHAEVKRRLQIGPELFRVPMGCNAFAAFGKATIGNRHFFGRNYQFPTGNIFQNQAAMIIYNPDYKFDDGTEAQPIVSMTAPGFIGSIAAMSNHGVALGVHVSMGSCTSYAEPGLNSLLLVRNCGHRATSGQAVVDTIIAARRGVTWIYPVADGPNNFACVVEAGASTPNYDPRHSVPPAILNLLPNVPLTPAQNGAMVRKLNDPEVADYLQCNQALFNLSGILYDPAVWGPTGMACLDWNRGNLPGSHYFAPQRETREDLMLAANHFIIPEMRLASMDDWVARLYAQHRFDFQWRYDKLNLLLHDAYSRIDEAAALKLVDFLAPDDPNTGYYANVPTVEGTMSLCDLDDKRMTSHYGYWADGPERWVKITLPRYVDP